MISITPVINKKIQFLGIICLITVFGFSAGCRKLDHGYDRGFSINVATNSEFSLKGIDQVIVDWGDFEAVSYLSDSILRKMSIQQRSSFSASEALNFLATYRRNAMNFDDIDNLSSYRETRNAYLRFHCPNRGWGAHKISILQSPDGGKVLKITCDLEDTVPFFVPDYGFEKAVKSLKGTNPKLMNPSETP